LVVQSLDHKGDTEAAIGRAEAMKHQPNRQSTTQREQTAGYKYESFEALRVRLGEKVGQRDFDSGTKKQNDGAGCNASYQTQYCQLRKGIHIGKVALKNLQVSVERPGQHNEANIPGLA